MRKRTWRDSILVSGTVVLLVACEANPEQRSFAGSHRSPATTNALKFDVSLPLRSLTVVPTESLVRERWRLPVPIATSIGPDTVVQSIVPRKHRRVTRDTWMLIDSQQCAARHER